MTETVIDPKARPDQPLVDATTHPDSSALVGMLPSAGGYIHMPLRGAMTDEGYVHKKNEDSWEVFKLGPGSWEEEPAASIYVAIVADGVTSQSGGAQASQLAVETIKQVLRSRVLSPTDYVGISAAVDDAIQQANRKILDVARRNPEWGNMSTTLVMGVLAGGTLQLAHLGDSRAYLVRGDQIHRLTLDHTWAQDALDHGRITPAELERNPNRNVIRRFLGIKQRIEIDRIIVAPGTYHSGVEGRVTATTIPMEADDVLLLCTDGLSDKVTEAELYAIVDEHRGRPQNAAELLIKAALAKKEQDNITAVLLSLAAATSATFAVRRWGWLVGVLLLVLLAGGGFWISQGLTPSLPEPTPLPIPIAMESQTPTVVATPTATASSSPTPTIIVTEEAIATEPPTIAPLLEATATATRPPPTEAATHTPTATFTPSPTVVVPTATPTSRRPATAPSTPTAAQQPARAEITTGVSLTAPDDDTTTAGPVNFRFTTAYQLVANEGFEVVVWQGGAPLVNGYGVAAPLTQISGNGEYRVSGDLSGITINAGGDRLRDGSYQWGVLVVRDNPYTRIAHLGGERLLHYNPGGGGGGSGTDSGGTGKD